VRRDPIHIPAPATVTAAEAKEGEEHAPPAVKAVLPSR
jgi:hypothetical protein